MGVEVQKVTMLHQGPKWHRELNSMKNKILDPTIKKNDGKPKSIKDFKEESQAHEWVSFRTHETKGRGKPQPIEIRNLLGKNWAGIPGDCQKLGILVTCSEARAGWRQFKGDAKKHKEREWICPYQPPNDAERDQKAWEPIIHEQGVRTSENPERRVMKGSGWETFNLAGRNQLTWKKWQRERQPKKLSLKKVGTRNLERRKTQGHLFRTY